MSRALIRLIACGVLMGLGTMLCHAEDPVPPYVSLSLESPLDGEVVQPGDTIDWTVSFTVQPLDNSGLALVLVDFVQNKLNPGKFVIPYATAVPAGMGGFARPAGISNPGDGGYGGTQLGTDCEANLYQIGGAQNTFGVQGDNMGQDTDVDEGVGQGSPQTLASAEFDAPAERGVYIFQIEDAVANVLAENSPPPNEPWPVISASTTYDSSSFVIIVCPGDVDGDGDVDMSDLTELLGAYGTCEGEPGYDPDADLDDSGCVDTADLAILLTNYGTTCT